MILAQFSWLKLIWTLLWHRFATWGHSWPALQVVDGKFWPGGLSKVKLSFSARSWSRHEAAASWVLQHSQVQVIGLAQRQAAHTILAFLNNLTFAAWSDSSWVKDQQGPPNRCTVPPGCTRLRSPQTPAAKPACSNLQRADRISWHDSCCTRTMQCSETLVAHSYNYQAMIVWEDHHIL